MAAAGPSRRGDGVASHSPFHRLGATGRVLGEEHRVAAGWRRAALRLPGAAVALSGLSPRRRHRDRLHRGAAGGPAHAVPRPLLGEE